MNRQAIAAARQRRGLVLAGFLTAAVFLSWSCFDGRIQSEFAENSSPMKVRVVEASEVDAGDSCFLALIIDAGWHAWYEYPFKSKADLGTYRVVLRVPGRDGAVPCSPMAQCEAYLFQLVGTRVTGGFPLRGTANLSSKRAGHRLSATFTINAADVGGMPESFLASRRPALTLELRSVRLATNATRVLRALSSESIDIQPRLRDWRKEIEPSRFPHT